MAVQILGNVRKVGCISFCTFTSARLTERVHLGVFAGLSLLTPRWPYRGAESKWGTYLAWKGWIGLSVFGQLEC